MQATVNGFRQQGTWNDVVQAGRRVETAFRDAGSEQHPRMGETSYEQQVNDWATWRPHQDEDLTTLRERTAEMVSTTGPVGAAEEAIYNLLTLRVSPLFFDNELVTAELGRQLGGDYEIEINVHRDELRDAVGDNL